MAAPPRTSRARSSAAGPPREEFVARYKTILRQIVDRNPSGLRLKIAKTLSTHKSFVSQITNPADPTPIPARHVPALFELCHFAPEERVQFMAAFTGAHPKRAHKADARANGKLHTRIVKFEVPVRGDAARQRALERHIQDFILKIAELL